MLLRIVVIPFHLEVSIMLCTPFYCSAFQPSADTILQETVQREAYNGVYDINTTKVVTPAVLVGVCVCVCVCVCVYNLFTYYAFH